MLKEAGCIDTAYGMDEAWDGVNDQDKNDIPMVLREYDKSAQEKDVSSEYSSAITGCFSMYDLEIDCAGLSTDGSCGVLFENIFHDNICLERDFPEYLEDNADYWVESTVMKDLVKEEFNISTSLLLQRIIPDPDGKVRLKVVNKLVNDARTDHGWYM